MTTFVSQQARRTAPALSLAVPAQRVARSFAAVGTAFARSYRAFDAASDTRRNDVAAVSMLMHARD